jgi:hypothetical protein
VEIGLAEHRIFGDQAVMLERKHVGRDQPVGACEPAFAVSGGVIGDDQVEIQHQPFELPLAKTRAVEQDGPRRARVAPGDSRSHCRDARIHRLGKLGRDQIV